MAKTHRIQGDLELLGIQYMGNSHSDGTTRTIELVGSETDISLVLTPKGSGTIQVPSGYEDNISSDQDLVNAGYANSKLGGIDLDALITAPGAGQDGYVVTYDHDTTSYKLVATASALTFDDGLSESGGTVKLGGDINDSETNITQSATGVTRLRTRYTTGSDEAGIAVEAVAQNNNQVTLYGVGGSIRITPTIMTVTAPGTGAMAYAADYSANYTVRSAPDVNFVNTHIGGKAIDANITSPTGSEDGYVIGWQNGSTKYKLVPFPSASSGYTFVEKDGSALTQRSTLNFVGIGFTVTDTGAKTTVTLSDYTIEEVSTTTYTFVEDDRFKIKKFTNASGCTATMPTSLPSGWSSVAYRATGAGDVVFASDGTLVGAGNTLESESTAASIIHLGSDVHTIIGAVGPSIEGIGLVDGDKGDVTVSGDGLTWTIDDAAVTFAKMQDVSTSRFLGRVTSGSGDIEQLTGTQATTLLNVFTSTLKGLTPSSGGGTTNFLRADGTWAVPPGAGMTVPSNTQIAYSNGTSLVGTSNLRWDGTGLVIAGTLDINIGNDTDRSVRIYAGDGLGSSNSVSFSVFDGSSNTPSINISSYDSNSDLGRLTASSGQIRLEGFHASEQFYFTIDGDANIAQFVDQRTVKVGIQYQSDYSADFTNRSLVDKAYVDSVLVGWPLSGSAALTGDVTIFGGTRSLNIGSLTPLTTFNLLASASVISVTNLELYPISDASGDYYIGYNSDETNYVNNINIAATLAINISALTTSLTGSVVMTAASATSADVALIVRNDVNGNIMQIDGAGNIAIGYTGGYNTTASPEGNVYLFNANTIPSGGSIVSNGIVMYAADISSSSVLHIRNEAGQIIKLYQPNAGSAYSVSNGTSDRTFDADSTSTAELADIVATLIADLKTIGFIA